MSFKKKKIKEGRYKGHVVLHDEDSGVTHHMIPHHMLPHHMLTIYPKDILQVIIGASILAIPVGLTQETWDLGTQLPLANVVALSLISILFTAAFIFYNYYKHRIHNHKWEFFSRVMMTYFLSLFVVSVLMTIIAQAPWTTDFTLAMKRVIIVTFPATMSAAVADVLK